MKTSFVDNDYQYLMAGGDVYLLAKKLVEQTGDRWKLSKKLGDKNDLIQSVGELLLSVRSGKSKFSFAGFVMAKMRGKGQENWMNEAPGTAKQVQIAADIALAAALGDADARWDDEDEDEDEGDGGGVGDAFSAHAAAEFSSGKWNHQDRHDALRQSPVQQFLQADSNALAALLGVTERTIRNLRKTIR